jgi:hypothetical protein
MAMKNSIGEKSKPPKVRGKIRFINFKGGLQREFKKRITG